MEGNRVMGSCEPERQGQVTIQMNSLESGIISLRENISKLRKRLTIISTVSPEIPTTKKKLAEEPLVPLANRIRNNIEEINRANIEIKEIIKECEL